MSLFYFVHRAYDDLTKQCEEGKEKFSECEKADVKLREDLKHAKAKGKKLEKSTDQEKKKVKLTLNELINVHTHEEDTLLLISCWIIQ